MMLRTTLTAMLAWMVMGTAAWAGTPIPPDDQPVHDDHIRTCADVIAVAEQILTPDDVDQLMWVSEDDCVALYRGWPTERLREYLRGEWILLFVDNRGTGTIHFYTHPGPHVENTTADPDPWPGHGPSFIARMLLALVRILCLV